MKRKSTLAPVVVLAGIVGCPQNQESSSPPPTAATPKSAAPSGAASGPSGAASGPAAANKAASPHGKIDNRPSGSPFSGLIKLGDGVKQGDIKPTDVLFVMARQSLGPNQGGQLVAVQRFAKVEFPKRYEMSQSNVMVPGIPFAGPFLVMARLDRDGDPMTKGPDDLYAAVTTPVQNGQEAVHLVLKKGAAVDVTPPKPGAASQPSKAASRPK